MAELNYLILNGPSKFDFSYALLGVADDPYVKFAIKDADGKITETTAYVTGANRRIDLGEDCYEIRGILRKPTIRDFVATFSFKTRKGTLHVQ